jgi:hypothetical protein
MMAQGEYETTVASIVPKDVKSVEAVTWRIAYARV